LGSSVQQENEALHFFSVDDSDLLSVYLGDRQTQESPTSTREMLITGSMHLGSLRFGRNIIWNVWNN
jgi:hypothetical protein